MPDGSILGTWVPFWWSRGAHGASNGHLEAHNSRFIDFRVHFRRLLGSTLGSLVFLWALWDVLLRPRGAKRRLEVSKRPYQANAEVVIFVCVFVCFLRLLTPSSRLGTHFGP